MKIIKKGIGLISILLICESQILSQPNQTPTDLYGEAFKNWLKAEWYDAYQNISYNASKGYRLARLAMYNDIDNFNDTMYCFYSSFPHVVPTKGYNSAGDALPFNCEHIVPQSFFNSRAPMKNDIHHLAPTYSNWNSARGSFPFAENDDNETEKWMYLNESVNCDNAAPCIPEELVDEYSELISYQSGSYFEPKEASKGNVARSIFYFFTMYPDYDISLVGDVNTFYEWHQQDPVNEADEKRNNETAGFQGNHNPYISHPEWVYKAWIADTIVDIAQTPLEDEINTQLIYGIEGKLVLDINNPTKELLTINIHNIYGEIIHQYYTGAQHFYQNVEFNRNQYGSGLYLMSISTKDQTVDTYVFYLM